MRTFWFVLATFLFSISSYCQVSFLQYRVVPPEHEEEFIMKETKYWAKVAKAAIDNGHMLGWALWEKVGVTTSDAPNYVFVNIFKDFDSIDEGAVWSDDNMMAIMGVSPDLVETFSISSVTMEYWMQLEDAVSGDYTYAIVNYGLPTSRADFISENKKIWKPLHEKNIASGDIGMTSWGLMSTVYPQGNEARFSCLTWDGFNKMADAMNYLRYQEWGDTEGPLADALSQSKMDEIMPEGFEYRILYKLVKRVSAD